MEAVPVVDGAEGICVEDEPKVSGLKGSRHGTVCTFEKVGKELYRYSNSGMDLETEADGTYPIGNMERDQNRGNAISWRKLTGLQALYYSYLYQMGVLKKRPAR